MGEEMSNYDDCEKAVFDALETARKTNMGTPGEHWTLVFHLTKALILAVLTIAKVLDDRP
jgi:hypothetical protein